MRLAGGSIIHEEFHSDAYSKSGGSLVMNSQPKSPKPSAISTAAGLAAWAEALLKLCTVGMAHGLHAVPGFFAVWVVISLCYVYHQ